MRRLRVLIWSVLSGILLLSAWFTWRGLSVIGSGPVARAEAVPQGDQEIAWINAATSLAAWERFVAAVRKVEEEVPGLRVDYRNAFPEQTAAVAEVAVGLDGCTGKLWFRWYKMTSEAGIHQWVAELGRRDPPPLAIIGGGSSDRARDLACALQHQASWKGPPPLLLLTTATAIEVDVDHPERPIIDLMKIYHGQTFRFCFNNTQMADAVRDFVWDRPYLRPFGSPTLALGGLFLAPGDLWGSLALQAVAPQLQPPVIHVLEWQDDPYSRDLSNHFCTALIDPRFPEGTPEAGEVRQPTFVTRYGIPYSVGSFAQPNPQEAVWIDRMMRSKGYSSDQRELLVLPTVERPARRVIRGLVAAAPQEFNSMVAVTGDSIPFNTICRDRHFAWNVLDLPVPLVFFCHQDPVAGPADEAAPGASATDDLLFNADIVRVVVEAAFGVSGGAERLLTSSAELGRRIHQRQPPFFHPDGNRLGGAGEFVCCLRPQIEGQRVLPAATIEVWTRLGAGWKHVRSLRVDYLPPQ